MQLYRCVFDQMISCCSACPSSLQFSKIKLRIMSFSIFSYLQHWPHLRKHNGERYAYSSHSQAVLDCLRNRSEWARLVDRGPKVWFCCLSKLYFIWLRSMSYYVQVNWTGNFILLSDGNFILLSSELLHPACLFATILSIWLLEYVQQYALGIKWCVSAASPSRCVKLIIFWVANN